MLSLGKRIRELRTKKQLTQIDLAKNLCTPSMISQIEADVFVNQKVDRVANRKVDHLGAKKEGLSEGI